ncbi:MAG: translation initiation factor IF-2, partial [Allopontixanthobacter sediminis]
MSDTEDKPTRTRKPLGLSRAVDAGEVKQTFSHGRTNKVTVEVKRRRKLVKPGEAPPVEEVVAPTPAPTPPPAPAPAPKPVAKKAPVSDETAQERVARMQREAEEDRLRSAEEARRREEEEKAKALAEEKQRAEANREGGDAAPAEEEAKPAPEAKAPAAEPAKELDPEAEAVVEAIMDAEATPAPAARRFTPVARPETKRPEKKKKEEKRTSKAEEDRRRSGKLTVNRALNDDEGARARSLAALKRAREKERRTQGGGARKQREKQYRDVVVPEAITVQELAKRMGEKGADLVKALFNMDMMVTVNQTIDQDTAELLVEEFGHTIQRVSDSDVDIQKEVDSDPVETMRPRPPVVTIMGHVDHGKTSLLDALRGTDVVRGEAGGITQHIGSYQVTTKGGDKITFLDTPGHAAFTEMRQRGANVTDIVVLVVAADDGIMPQTIEAIKHTQAAGVPMIVAINKIDKPEANAQKIRERLLEHDVMVEAMSGDVQDVEISAKNKTNLDGLLDKIALQAELLELQARPDRPAEAIVIEAQLDKGRGPVATVLITRGTLKKGDNFVVGTESGKVRAIVDDQGKQIKEAGPSMPVEVLGLGGVPDAGEQLTVVENEQRAREVAQYRREKATETRTALAPTNFDAMFSSMKNDVVEFPVVVKA